MRGRGGRPDLEATHTAAWLDLGYDREFASDGVSRYGAYLRDRASWWDDDDAESDSVYAGARSAARCWEIANGPIMAPGLVRLHPRILTAHAAVDDYDGRQVVLTVRLVAGLPDGLRRLLSGWRSWQYQQRGLSEPAWVEPYDRTGRPVRMALPTLTLSWPVPAVGLPRPGGGLPDVAAAIDAVAAVAEVFNGELRPVLAHLAGRS
jgi:hypothetical protein